MFRGASSWPGLIAGVLILFAFTRASSAIPESLAIEVVDPNPSLLSPEGEVIGADTMEAVDRLSGNHPSRIGAAADGISQLVLRVRASNVVTFSVSPRSGRLRPLVAGSEDSTRVTVQPQIAGDGASWAFVLYTPPDVLAAERKFVIFAHDGIRSGVASLRLERPPVLFVHGLWSDSSTWNGLRDFLKRRDFRICEGVNCTVNYGPVQPAPSFDPFAVVLTDQFAVNHLIQATTNSLIALRQEGIAATQVDVVAHSLGGLIARSRVVLPDQERAYWRRDNFKRGDFHKLITIGTPHRGTPVADFLITNRSARSFLFGGATLEEYLATLGYPIGPAIEEMQTFSPTLVNIGATPGVPAHAIVGLAPSSSRTERSLNSLPRALGSFFTVDDLLGGNRQHDTLVPRDSEAGGLSGRAVTLARGTVHADIDDRDVGETDARFIWHRVAQLLRAPAQSKFFGNFAKYETNAVMEAASVH